MNRKTSAGLHEAGHLRRPRILVAWRGPSRFDGAPIRVVVYCLWGGSLNRKIGPMAQVLICPDDEEPHRAQARGTDVSVCGSCPLRRSNGGGCYVNLGAYFPRVWETSSDLPTDLGRACQAIQQTGLPLRIASWGDPAAAPIDVVEQLAEAAQGAGSRPRHTTYTAAWRDRPELRHLAMASVMSEGSQREATEAGWRTFRILGKGERLLRGEIVCPASPEGGLRATCSQCLACCGAGRRGPNVVVEVHGSAGKVAAIEKMLHDGTGPETRAQGKRRPLDAEGGLRGIPVSGQVGRQRSYDEPETSA